MQSMEINELATALAKVQAVLRGAKKDGENKHLRNRYASLESVWDACREPLTSNGLSVVQGFGRDELGSYMETTLLHSSGQWVSSQMPWDPPSSTSKGLKPAQELGSLLTYLRRYALSALVGICPVDDDGEAGRGHRPSRQQPQDPGRLAPQDWRPDEDAAVLQKRADEIIKAIPAGDVAAVNQWAQDNAPKLRQQPQAVRDAVRDAVREARTDAEHDAMLRSAAGEAA